MGHIIPELDVEDMNDNRPVSLQPVFSGDEFRRQVEFPVIVERWSHRLTGSGKRKYQAEFSEKERATIARYQTKFHRWYLVTGTPRRVMIRLQTLALLKRAVAFFASI